MNARNHLKRRDKFVVHMGHEFVLIESWLQIMRQRR